MENNIIDLEIRCPSCKKSGHMQVEEYPITHSSRGVSAISVSEDVICKHSFVLYIDRNLAVRDTFICDFRIKIPIISFKEDTHEVVEEIQFDIDIVRINLIPTLLINILRGIFFGKKIVVLLEEQFIREHLLKFFKHITNGSFKLQIAIKPRNYYKNNEKSYKDWIILERNKVIIDKDKIIDPKNLKIESVIAQKFYIEKDKAVSLIILKNEISKLYRLTEKLVDLAKDYETNDQLNSRVALDFFKKKFNITLDLEYLKFLMNILELYFKVKVRKVPDSADFLELL